MKQRDIPEMPPGTRIGGDVVEGLLGVGGFGAVYRVRSPDGYLAALKLLPLDEREEWVWRELTILARLRHSNLVCLLGWGRWPDYSPRYLWLKLELIEGLSLDAWAREHVPNALDVVDKVLGVGRGLAVVHEARVVHRDVKEANILVRQSDGEVVLVDFGAGHYWRAPTLTQGLLPPGTPLYRSPEAWRFAYAREGVPGAHYRAGPADDLYALGVVLYRLLTGRYPCFPVNEVEDVEAVIHRPPLPPYFVNPRVPRALSAVCSRLLEKQPEARYPSAVALCEALEELRAQSDETWKVPLREDGPARVPPTATTLPESRPRSGAAPQASRRAAAWVGMAVGLVLCGAWLVERWRNSTPESQERSPVTSSPVSPMREEKSGLEVAPSETTPEAGRAVAPPPVESTPATGASPAAPHKENAPVKKQQKTPGPQPAPRPERWGAAVRNACLGLTGAALQACTSAQQVPPVRTAPPPQECPAGAAETMKALELKEGLRHVMKDYFTVLFPGARGLVPVREGPSSEVRVFANWGKLPRDSILSGRLYFGEERVYGRFTEAITPSGETYTVCLELTETGEQVGVRMEPESTSDNVQVFSVQGVRPVARFE